MLFTDLFYSIRKNPVLFIFIFIQIVITSFIVYSAMSYYHVTEEESNRAQIVWGDKEYVFVSGKDSSFQTPEGIHQIVDLTWASGLGISENDTEKYDELMAHFDKIESFYTQAKQIDGLRIIVNNPSWQFFLLTEKDWEGDDMLVGSYGIFSRYPEFPQFSELNALYIGSDYTDYFQVDLSDGEYLKKEDFLYKGDYIPVLMGSKYKKYFELGEEFSGCLNGIEQWKNEERIFKVVGFIAENQYYTSVNAGDVRSYDNIILIPYPEMDLEAYKNEFREFKFLYASRLSNAYYIIDPDKYAQVREKLDDLLDETGLSENFCTYKKRIEKELSSNYADQLSISIFACALTLVFSLFSIVFTMLYKIDGNIKNYAIRMVVGETPAGITVRFLFEAFVLFIFGLPTSYCLFRVYYINYLRESEHILIKALKTGTAVNIIFCIVCAVTLYICVTAKFRKFSLSSLIHGKEVRKEKNIPFYKVIIFIMLSVISVFAMFITGYRVTLDRIDIYYNSYYTKNVKIAYVSMLSVEDAPEVSVDIRAICENVDNAIINKYVFTGYKGDDYISERGIYFNGYIDPVNMLYGRFFTHEEVAGKQHVAVVGKEIYSKYVTFNEKGDPVYHSDDLDADLLVIGVMGKEESETSIDFTVFFPIKVGMEKFGGTGSYTLDGKDKATVEKLAEIFENHVSATGMVSMRDYNPRITVQAPADLLIMLLILVSINAAVFCFYYVSKQEGIYYVKKIVGYSQSMMLCDTFTDFSVLAFTAFIAGNAVTFLLKETILKNFGIFSLYMPEPAVLIVSLVTVILFSGLLSVIATFKTFHSSENSIYRL